MILDPQTIAIPQRSDDPQEDHRSLVNVLDRSTSDIEVVADVLERPSQLGAIANGRDKHFYSNGAFNLIQLMLYVLRQTGPAHVFLSTYSIAEDSISTLRRYVDNGTILSIRFLIDNRVRSISPKPSLISFSRFRTHTAVFRCTQRWLSSATPTGTSASSARRTLRTTRSSSEASFTRQRISGVSIII